MLYTMFYTIFHLLVALIVLNEVERTCPRQQRTVTFRQVYERSTPIRMDDEMVNKIEGLINELCRRPPPRRPR